MAKKKPLREKRVDDTHYLAGKRRGGLLREEAWYEGTKLVKYSLAYINPRICGVDNGRVLGYDKPTIPITGTSEERRKKYLSIATRNWCGGF